jgi:peroxiredoxin
LSDEILRAFSGFGPGGPMGHSIPNLDTMKLNLIPSFVRGLFAATGLFASALLGAASVGQPAPAFTLTDLDGTSHSLSDFKGKTVVLEWVNPECPFVVKHYEKSGNLPATQKAAVADGVVWLLINSAAAGKQGDFDAAAAKAWMEKNQAAATAYLRDPDGKVGRAYDAKTTPHMYVINAEGVLVYNGAIDDKRSTNPKDIEGAENFVKSALAALKAGQPVATPTTQPYGCSVKY